MLSSHPSPCPNCGYCPCCGRGNGHDSPYPTFGTSSTPELDTDGRDDASSLALDDSTSSSCSADTDRSLTRRLVQY